MASGIKTGGRQKGTPNKLTGLARDAIAAAAENLGGSKRLTAWAKEDNANERVFWGTIYPKLLPLQLTGADGGPIETKDVTDDQRAKALAAFLAKNQAKP
jgi:hypothetical protein